MKILKENLETLWYEDEQCNKIACDENYYRPEGAAFQVSRFPNQLATRHLKLIKQEEVNKCKHPRKYIRSTYGEEWQKCGTQCDFCKD
jgi:hypothetical protein